MSWTEMEPFVRTIPHMKASIRVTARGAQLSLSFSDPFHRELGEPKNAKLLAGHGDHAGKILLRVDANGKCVIKPCVKGGARTIMPAPAGCPDGDRASEACALEKQADGGWVIALPLAAWANQIAPAPARKAPAATVRQPEPAPPTVDGSKTKVKALSYLIGKGHEVARTKTGFVLDGELCDLARITQKVNEYRRKADLPLVTVSDLVFA